MRPLSMSDVPALTRVLQENRHALVDSGPLRSDEHFTEAGQEEAVSALLASETSHPMLVVRHGDGEILGSLNFNSIIRGAFQSASIGKF